MMIGVILYGVLVVLASAFCIYTASLIAPPLYGTNVPQKGVRRLLAINLCEPAINVPLIGLTFYNQFRITGSVPETPLLFTLPMLVLLIPAIGLFFRNRDDRKRSAMILVLGLARLLIVVAIFSEVGLESRFIAVLFLVGLLLLGFSGWWGHMQLRHWKHMEEHYAILHNNNL